MDLMVSPDFTGRDAGVAITWVAPRHYWGCWGGYDLPLPDITGEVLGAAETYLPQTLLGGGPGVAITYLPKHYWGRSWRRL